MVKEIDKSGKFEVNSNDKVHAIDFNVPECTCKDWATYQIPCKHFFGVFRLFPEWGWEMLPQSYQDSPYLNLDEQAMSAYVQFPEEKFPENLSSSDSLIQQPKSEGKKLDEIPFKVHSYLASIVH